MVSGTCQQLNQASGEISRLGLASAYRSVDLHDPEWN